MKEADAEIVDRLRQCMGPLIQDAVNFKADSWRRRLDQHPAAQEQLDQLIESDSKIDRKYLRELASNLTAGGEDAHLRLFTAVMIWGAGTSDRRGPWRTQQALDSHPGPVLLRTAGLVAQGDLVDAYTTFRTCRVPRVGPAFFTKWLWAVGTRRSEPPWPLILDSRVKESLRALGWKDRKAANSRLLANRYLAYVNAVQRWAGALEIEPEDVEYMLFRGGGPTQTISSVPVKT